MSKNIVEKIEKIVRDKCLEEGNPYGERYWRYHIQSVVKIGRELAEKYGADVEIVEIAALLHDFARISEREWEKIHHIKGAEIAFELLNELNYPKDRIVRIQKCILTHTKRDGDVNRESIEQRILADSDAFSHIRNFTNLLFYTYNIAKMDVDEGRLWVLNEVEEYWGKISTQSKIYIEEDYRVIKKALSI
ncbi:MAG: HD domain-containing protein [bacterium]